jgi:enterochelin esterase-like enzyme
MEGSMRLVAMLAALWLALCGGGAMAQVPDGRLVTIESFASTHVKPRKVTIWLPADYDANPRRRFPVLYMHDGQNIFDAKTAYAGEWGVDEAVTRLSRQGDMRSTIVVGVWNTDLRYREYFPDKVYAYLPPAYRALVDEQSHNQPLLGDAYLAFLVRELKPYVDSHFRTLKGPADTSMMGSSMGGLISLYAIGEYPEVFGQVAAVSIHWPLGNPEAAPANTPEGPAMVAAAFEAWLQGTKIDPKRNRIYADRGSATLDASYPPYLSAIDAMMVRHGWVAGVGWESRAYTGASHNETSWRERIDIPLVFLDRK